MASVSTDCIAEQEDDGSWSLIITTRGLTEEEAIEMGTALADPVKIATIKAMRNRLTPASVITDSRNTDPGSMLQ